MDNWFNSKWFVRGVSLALAILLYVFVGIEVTKLKTDSRIPSNTDKTETLTDVPVDIRIDSNKFVVSGVPEFVTVSLEGANDILTSTIMQRNFDVYVDLEELGEGTHTVDVKHAKVPSKLSVYIEPKTIEIEIEERATEEFAVSVDFINKDQLPEGYELGTPVVNPEKVTITSSRSVIDQIAIVKVYVDVAGLTEKVKSREVPVNVYDNQGNVLQVRIEPLSVAVSVDVDNPSKKVPIEIATTGDLPEGYTLTSITTDVEELEVFATSNTLKELENISTEEIDLSKITESGTIDAKLALPSGAKLSEDSVKVTIEVEQTSTVEDVPVEIKSQDGQDVSFKDPANPAMNVTVVGSDKDISEFTADDFKLSIDVEDLGEGEHQVPVSIKGPKDVVSSVELEEVTIEITIVDTE